MPSVTEEKKKSSTADRFTQVINVKKRKKENIYRQPLAFHTAILCNNDRTLQLTVATDKQLCPEVAVNSLSDIMMNKRDDHPVYGGEKTMK